jgi:hypothetical protein
MNTLAAIIADQKVISSDICPEAIPLKQKSTYLIFKIMGPLPLNKIGNLNK